MNGGVIALVASAAIFAACGLGWVFLRSDLWTIHGRAAMQKPWAKMAGELLAFSLIAGGFIIPAIAAPDRAPLFGRLFALPGMALLLGGIFLRSPSAKSLGAALAIAGAIGADAWLRVQAGQTVDQIVQDTALPVALGLALVITLIGLNRTAAKHSRSGTEGHTP